MTRLCGRCPRGKPLHASAPCGRWRTTTMIGSVRQDGSTACMTVEGAVNAEVFRSYVREILLPTLSVGDILVMDNLSAHKDHQALDPLKNAGVTVRFLPANSPDLNPIELMWSKVKALLCKAEARTNEALLLAIGDELSTRTPKLKSHVRHLEPLRELNFSELEVDSLICVFRSFSVFSAVLCASVVIRQVSESGTSVFGLNGHPKRCNPLVCPLRLRYYLKFSK